MATIQMYNRCIDTLAKLKVYSSNMNEKSKRLRYPDLKFFKVKMLIDESELPSLSEAEQRRHRREDDMLCTLYAEMERRLV